MKFLVVQQNLAAVILCVLISAIASAAPPQTAPVPGLREVNPDVHAIVGAKIVVSPERTLERGVLVIRSGVIVAVGEDIIPPADARLWNGEGKTLYPGFIDPYTELSNEASSAGRNDSLGAAYWNPNVVPQVRAERLYQSNAAANRKYRSQGITARLVAPSVGMIKGTSALVTTGDGPGRDVILKEQVALHAKLTVSRGASGYPNSPMGALTLVRQAFYDAGWHRQAWDSYEQNRDLPRPERNDALAVLQEYPGRRPAVVIDAGDALYFLRADRVAKEFGLNLIVRGSGEEYRRLDEIVATGRPVIVPINFPRAPNVATPEAAMNVELERLMHWDLAPENAVRLATAGVKIALTGFGLREEDSFLAAVRKVVERGLEPDAALKALTVTPAELFEASDRLGTLEVGKAANVVVTDGPLFDSTTKVLETWVDGQRYENEPVPALDLRGTWQVQTKRGDQETSFAIELKRTADKLSGEAKFGEKVTPLVSVNFREHQISATLRGTPLDQEGFLQLSATVTTATSGNAEPKTDASELSWIGTLVWPDGTRSSLTATRTKRADPEEQKAETTSATDTDPTEESPTPDVAADTAATAPTGEKIESAEAAPADQSAIGESPARKGEPRSDKTIIPEDKQPVATTEQIEKTPERAISEVNYPLGAYGRQEQPEQFAAVLFRGATVWTCGPDGKLDEADVLVESGKIRAVGKNLSAPDGAAVVEAAGKHITPGIIDCHSHAATDGGINESGQTITAEVRIGDFIDPTDISIYRQLAGGVTTANILHGSANTIGGQNQVVKFRWGAGPEELKFHGAPDGIKFALGENVKQSNWGDHATTRYPQTRMGVEQLLQDAFRAAQLYRQSWDEWKRIKTGIPPRVDLELEAIAEVIEGKRLIHCHSYRQDEILALLRVCEQYDVKVATLQHILEGYKAADTLAKHGAGASSFADWWGYKFEVFDAIPYNGALLHNAGVLVSFNSDDAELARRLNQEAAKAVKYGGVDPEEALKFVTLNPAKQLRIDSFVGSIEPGKDADLVVWSGPPLSSYTRCEQTWVDGRRYFALVEDQQQRAAAAELRAKLVQRILQSGVPTEDAEDAKKEQWPREDIFCEHGIHDAQIH